MRKKTNSLTEQKNKTQTENKQDTKNGMTCSRDTISTMQMVTKLGTPNTTNFLRNGNIQKVHINNGRKKYIFRATTYSYLILFP